MRDEQFRWTDPAWLAEAGQWIDDQLKQNGIHRTGELVQPHVRPWSTVLRVPTDRGSFYFKALPDNLRHEVPVVAGLGERFPGRVPRLLAWDRRRGWMLQWEGGELYRQELKRTLDIDSWFRVLSAYAEMQIALAQEHELLLSWGVPDRRPIRLPLLIRALLNNHDALHLDDPRGLSQADLGRLGDCIHRLDELSDELSDGPVPLSLDHGDLHDGNIFVDDGEFIIFDWGDCSLTHPFFSLRTVFVSIENRLGWEEGDRRFAPLLAHYTAAWRSFGESEELHRLAGLALAVAPLVAALRWHRALANLPEGVTDYVEPVPRLLEEFLANLDRIERDR